MKQKPLFILGRFRSGTSHFWHIFNQLSEFKAWYEPLHPQLLSQIKYTEPKADHVHIEDYWTAYRSLKDLSDHHDIGFGSRRLYLTAQDSWSELRQYLDYLITASDNLQPVLQFNRMDFRMPWLTGFYPQAKTLYLKRNPLQLWYSQRKHIPEEERINESYADAYELMQWCTDLAPLLPFLSPQRERHAFYRFYMLYRLSVIMGTHYADVVIDLEEDVFNSDDYLEKLKQLGLGDKQLKSAHALKHVPDGYNISDADMDRLTEIMSEVDALLEVSGLAAGFGIQSLSEIKQSYPDFWQNLDFNANAVIAELNQSWHQEQAEKIKLLAELDQTKKQLDHNE
jgi:hypothetical protein